MAALAQVPGRSLTLFLGVPAPQPTGTLPLICFRYLALAAQARLLKPGPDALNSASVLWVTVSVSTGALVLQHQGVIHKAWEVTDRGHGQ